MQRTRKRKTQSFSRFPLSTVIGGVGTLAIAIGLITSYLSPTAQYERAAKQQIRQQEADAYVAHRRYESGCTMPWVYRADGAIQAIALSKNVAYTDGSFGVPMTVGDLLCDDNGLTGELGESGYLKDPRRASNMDLVNQRFDDSMGWHKQPVRSNTSFANQ